MVEAEPQDDAGEPRSGSATTPLCPRCDHDLRSEPMSWTTVCPLEGRCTECGLAFRWADLLHPGLSLPAWSVEGPARWRDAARRLPAQLVVATVLPRLLHRQLRLEHRRRPGRLLAVVGLLAAAVLLLPSGLVVWAGVSVGMPPTVAWLDAVRPLRATAATATAPLPRAAGRRPRSAWVVTEDGRGGLRWQEVQAWRLRSRPTFDLAEITSGPPALRVATNRVRLPSGLVVGVTGPLPASPAVTAALAGPIRVPITGPVPRDVTIAWAARMAFFGLPVILVPVASAGSFVLLPVVRRRARVAAGHILRLLLLGLMPTVPAAGLLASFTTLEQVQVGRWFIIRRLGDGSSSGTLLLEVGLPLLLLAAAVFAWIWSAAATHLRLERAAAVAAATTAVGVTAVGTAWFVLSIAL